MPVIFVKEITNIDSVEVDISALVLSTGSAA